MSWTTLPVSVEHECDIIRKEGNVIKTKKNKEEKPLLYSSSSNHHRLSAAMAPLDGKQRPPQTDFIQKGAKDQYQSSSKPYGQSWEERS